MILSELPLKKNKGLRFLTVHWYQNKIDFFKNIY